jgi:hypothetical protein
MSYAPIALFVYKRPVHTRRVIESLMRCPEFQDSQVYVFCDGAKKPQDLPQVQETREVIKSMIGDSAIVIESSLNKGLAESIIYGVEKILDSSERVIVVEDDLIVNEKFLEFVNCGLEKFQLETQVMQVSGHMFDVPEFENRIDALFLPFTTSWGWGTWKRAWKHFDAHCVGWEAIKTDHDLRYSFDLNGAYDYSVALEQQMLGETSSWAIRWYWSVFKLNGYCLFPANSYVNNIGFDDTATHGYISSQLLFSKRKKKPVTATPNDFVLPEVFAFNGDDLRYVAGAFSSSLKAKILKKIKKAQRFVKRFSAKLIEKN